MTTNQKLIYDKCLAELSLATAELSREYYYDSLPQCVIDAVFSIGVKYGSTRKTVIKYCEKFNIKRIADPINAPSDSHTIDELINNITPYSDFGLYF